MDALERDYADVLLAATKRHIFRFICPRTAIGRTASKIPSASAI